MTHDQFCPWRIAEESDTDERFLAGIAVCECELIMRVRENESARCYEHELEIKLGILETVDQMIQEWEDTIGDEDTTLYSLSLRRLKDRITGTSSI